MSRAIARSCCTFGTHAEPERETLMRFPDLHLLTLALASPHNQPVTAFDALCRLCDEVVSAKLFTITDHDPNRDLTRRLYSNMPDAYPVSGTKPVDKGSAWYVHVVGRQQIFIANDYAAIANVFPDHAFIQSLGCEAVINIPIVVAGRVLGTLNCLDAKGTYTREISAAAESLKLPGAACMLLSQSLNGRGAG